MLAGPKVGYFESFALINLVYPTRFGLRHAYPAERINQLLHISNRLFVIQCDTPDGLKTLLAEPSDHERNDETPFFRGGQITSWVRRLDRYWTMAIRRSHPEPSRFNAGRGPAND